MEEENSSNELLEKSIKSKLKNMDYLYDALNDKEKKYLIKIEDCIQQIIDRESRAKTLLTKNNISIKSISEQTQIARQTFYNIPLLSEYINYNCERFQKIDISFILNTYQEDIKRLKSEILAMRKRDVQLEEMKIEINTLKQQIKVKDETLLSLRNRMK